MQRNHQYERVSLDEKIERSQIHIVRWTCFGHFELVRVFYY